MSQPPEFYLNAKAQHPELFEHYENLSRAAANAGPLDPKAAALVKLGLAVGAGLEGAAHSAVRKARSAGCSPEELHHACLLAVTTLGFPSMMRARAWVDDVLKKPQ